MGRGQREKGKRGERQAARAITEAIGVQCRRGVQYQGGAESADLQAEIPGVHWEVKFVEREAVRQWMRQAVEDAGDGVPVVVHRKSREPWLVTVPLERVYEFALRLAEAVAASISEVGAAEVPGSVSAAMLPEASLKNAGDAGVL